MPVYPLAPLSDEGRRIFPQYKCQYHACAYRCSCLSKAQYGRVDVEAKVSCSLLDYNHDMLVAGEYHQRITAYIAQDRYIAHFAAEARDSGCGGCCQQ